MFPVRCNVFLFLTMLHDLGHTAAHGLVRYELGEEYRTERVKLTLEQCKRVGAFKGVDCLGKLKGFFQGGSKDTSYIVGLVSFSFFCERS